jgi:hypothetical protein
MVGDVWDALDGGGFQVTAVATGRRLLAGPAGESIFLHGRELVGGLAAAESLLAQLASWGITPVASGQYFPPPGADPVNLQPYSALPQQPQAA